MRLLPLVRKAQKNNPDAMLMILTIETVQNYNLDQTPGFWEFVHRDNMSNETAN